nr:ribonuclease H-like domain-containing protein [Tanacetum cinerariifolium]
MSTPTFAETHNLVAFLEKPSESEGFEQIIDFFNAKPIRYALTMNPTVYASCVKTILDYCKGEKVNGQEQIQVLVDKQKRQGQGFSGNVTPLFKTTIVNAKKEVGEGLGLHTDSHHTPTDTQPSSSKPQNKIKPKRKQRLATEVHSPSSKIPVEESISTPSNDPLPSGEDSIQLNELMIFCTNLQQQVLELEEAKTAQAKEIANLKKRVKKLEIKRKSRPAGLRRLKKVSSSKQVESSEEEDSLGAQEDASKRGGSIEDNDQDAKITLVDEAKRRMHDTDMFRVNDLQGNEVIVDVREKIIEKEVSTADPVTTVGEVVTAASVEDSAAPTTATTADVDDKLTLAKTLIAIKAAKPKVISTIATTVTTAITTPRAKGIVFHEQVQAHIPTVFSSKDKAKAKIIELEKPLKKKDQITLDEYVARKLEAEIKAKMEEEKRIAREKDEANRDVIEEWNDVQAIINADRRKYFATKRAKEIRNKPPIKAQQKSLICTYMKHIEGFKQKDFKGKSFDDIKKMFDKVYKRVNTFVDMNTENVENFKREDLEVLKSIVKERFKKTKPVDDMDNLLFQTLKTMFEPHVEDIIRKYQQGVVKVNNWKLFDLCGVYYVTTKNMVYYLLVEKMYPFTNSILHQLWSDVRLQVDYKVEMAYDLLRLIRRLLLSLIKLMLPRSKVTTVVRFSTAGWIKWLEDQDMLGHPSDQVVDVLQHDLNFTKDSKVTRCDIYHKAKQTIEHFPISDHQTTVIDKVFISLFVYVDGIVKTSNDLVEIEKFKIYLKSKFQVKDLGKLKYFLGIEVLDNKEGIYLSQRKYCLEILHEYGLLATKHVDTPLPKNTTLHHKDDDHLLKIYWELSEACRSSAEAEYTSTASATYEVADVLSKALDIEQHKSLCVKLGMLDMFKSHESSSLVRFK